MAAANHGQLLPEPEFKHFENTYRLWNRRAIASWSGINLNRGGKSSSMLAKQPEMNKAYHIGRDGKWKDESEDSDG